MRRSPGTRLARPVERYLEARFEPNLFADTAQYTNTEATGNKGHRHERSDRTLRTGRSWPYY